MKQLLKISILAFFLFIMAGTSIADERVDLIDGDKDPVTSTGSGYILDASWQYPDPNGEFDPSLGAAAALNRALGLIFTGNASHSQIAMERQMAEATGDNSFLMAPFAVQVLEVLQNDWEETFPEPVALNPFSLAPSEPPTIMPDNPNIVALRYDDEEYLERLLQRLYFKLIQGPVLLTVPYQGDAPNVPEEFKNWNNFRYGNDTDTMVWDDTRYVWVDWNLTHTVVLMYEDGQIACYDSGRKYYIDHTAAIVAAGAMLAHPDYARLPEGTVLNYVLARVE
ncbi:MAG: hypothetical protein NTY09_04215 [bacterium]|nr:hypothetical protein [bacterium]